MGNMLIYLLVTVDEKTDITVYSKYDAASN